MCYRSCGKKYASDVGDMEMAAVCFAKAEEFAGSAKAVASSSESGARAVSKAMFDLLLGSAECSWEQDNSTKAEELVAQASEYLQDLPEECEYMASILFNLGLFCYQAKEPDRALVWLSRSLETRGMNSNPVPDAAKQAKTQRLCGVCHLAQKNFDEALKMMEEAEETCHDPVGAYLLLKLSILTQSSDVMTRLMHTLSDPDATLDVCMGSIALLTDAQRLKEAVSGFEKLAQRFATDPVSTVKLIAPRFFETLSSLGEAQSALELFDTVEISLNVLADDENAERSQLADTERRRWCALLLYSGSALAERKEFESAALMLGRCLKTADKIARRSPAAFEKSRASAGGELGEAMEDEEDGGQTDAASSDVVFKNEASICRLAASCALFAATELKLRLYDEAERDLDVGKLLVEALNHAQKAKNLDEDDFAARLLIFRIHLMRGEHAEATFEMKHASDSIHDFDVGALAEAACEAKDAGSYESVLAVLRCVLRAGALDQSTLERTKSLMKDSKPGFYGAIFLSAVHLAVEKVPSLKEQDGTEGANLPGTADEKESHFLNISFSESELEDLLGILHDGYNSILRVGTSTAFDDKVELESSLRYLADVAWNMGRYAGTRKWYPKWHKLFDVCCKLSSLRHPSPDILETRRVCNVMCATALIEQRNEGLGDESAYAIALTNLAEARALFTQMRAAVSPTTLKQKDAAGLSLLLLTHTLEARCFAGLSDQTGMSKVIGEVKNGESSDADVLEQLAAIAFNTLPAGSASADDKLLRLENVVTCLGAALDIRMLMPKIDVKRCSALLRELLGVELCNLSGCNRSYSTLKRSIGLMEEHRGEFPNEERRWMTATAWDAAQMHCKTGKTSEARRWAEAAIKCATGNAGLSTYISRIQAFINNLGSA